MVSFNAQIDTAHRDAIHDAQMNYYGNRLATCSSDRMVKIFDVKPTGQAIPVAELSGHKGPVWSVAWAHPRFQALLASASFDKTIIIWKETNGTWAQHFRYTDFAASVNGIAFAPQNYGLILAAVSGDNTLLFLTFRFEESQWHAKKVLKAHEQGINAVSWAPYSHSEGSMRVATAGNDNLVKVWRYDPTADDWVVEKQLTGHTDLVRDVSWAPFADSGLYMIASCGLDGQVLVWRSERINEPGSWAVRALCRCDTPALHVSWSLSPEPLLSVSTDDNRVTLWKQNQQRQWRLVYDSDNVDGAAGSTR